MREFALVDGNGEEYSLTVKESFLHDPSGLGFEHDNTYRQVGDRFIKVNTNPKQGKIEGTIHFHPESAYDEYQNFVEFAGRDGLKLEYRMKEMPARSIKTKVGIVEWANISENEHSGSFDFVTGAYSFTEQLIECDGSETFVKKTDCIYALQGLTNARDITKPVYCNGLPALEVNAGEYTETLGCGTLLGGNANEILFALHDEALDNLTIEEWVAKNKPQFCYTLSTPVTGTASEYIFNPNLQYNPVLTSQDEMNITYHDADENIVYQSGTNIKIENTLPEQTLDGLIVESTIQDKNANSFFRRTSSRVLSFDELDWSNDPQPTNRYRTWKNSIIDFVHDNTLGDVYPVEMSFLTGLKYGKQYQLNSAFIAKDVPVNSTIQTGEDRSRSFDIKVEVVPFWDKMTEPLTQLDSNNVVLRLTLVAQDKPPRIRTDNVVPLFSIEGPTAYRTTDPITGSPVYMHNQQVVPNDDAHFIWHVRKIDATYNQLYLTLAFDESVNKVFEFVADNNSNSETYNLYFAMYLEIVSQNNPQTQYVEFLTTDAAPMISGAIRLSPIAAELVPISHEETTETLYLVSNTPHYVYDSATGPSSDAPALPWTEETYDYVAKHQHYSYSHGFESLAYVNSEHYASKVPYDTSYGRAIYPIVQVSTGGGIFKYPIISDVTESIHQMSPPSETSVKLYNSESQRYSRQVEVSKLEKTELDKNSSLESKVTFECIEPWIDPVTSYGESNVMSVLSDSHTLGPCTIYISGPVKYPKWEQYVDGSLISTGVYNGAIAEEETLEIHTKQGENSMYLYGESTVQDVYQNSDFTTDRFMYIRYGNNEFRVSVLAYIPTSDTSFVSGKTYYELVDGNYVATSDSTMDAEKTYYESNSVDGDIECRLEGELYYESV